MRTPANPSIPSLDQLYVTFLTLVPRIELHAAIYFRHVRCSIKKEDCIAEAVALSWKWFLRLVAQGKDPTQFSSALASFAARAVRSGRRLVGMEKLKDVLSPVAQQQRRFSVSPLPQGSGLSGNVFDEALTDNTVSPVPDQVAFRLDFPAWRLSRCERDRRLIDDLVVGERTLDVAQKHGLSPGRISQLRRDFKEDWQRFTCDPAEVL